VLKSGVDVLAPFLVELFNRSLAAGDVPNIFKAAYITPLLKKTRCRPERRQVLPTDFQPVCALKTARVIGG
jgi:hypothetical protein